MYTLLYKNYIFNLILIGVVGWCHDDMVWFEGALQQAFKSNGFWSLAAILLTDECSLAMKVFEAASRDSKTPQYRPGLWEMPKLAAKDKFGLFVNQLL